MFLAARMLDSPRFVEWAFQHYLEICPPQFALAVTAGKLLRHIA